MARFRIGDRVRVIAAEPATHHRTPGYIKGRVGRVHALSGLWPNPETLAYGADGLPERELYLVAFSMRDLWGERSSGPAGDVLLVDVYEQWLEPAGAPDIEGGTG